MLDGLRLNRCDISITHKLVTVARCGIKTLLRIRTYLGLQLLGNSKNCRNDLFFSTGTPNIVLKLDKATNLSMTKQDRVENNFVRKFICARFHHHHGIMRAGYGEI